MSKNCLGLVCFSLFVVTLSAIGSSRSSIRTITIDGDEVCDIEAWASGNGESVTVSGTGFEVFPNRTCGYPEIEFVKSNGRILLRKDTVYEISDFSYRNSRPAIFVESRYVRFAVTVPISAPVALVVVRHHSTGGCEHDWSLQYALDWLIDRIFSHRK